MAWSGGKDSAEALWRLQKDPAYEVAGLLTTVTETYQRISMHGVRVALLEAQAAALGLPLHKVMIPTQCSNADYEAKMGAAIAALLEQGVAAMGFGDLFLEDIRAYRERMLAPTGMQPLFPIWGEPTAALARAIVAAGFRATLCCVDPRALAPEFAGRSYDASLLEDLPRGVDPCGENGEFHTFVFDGPNFSCPVALLPGERVEREGFWFFDLVPGPAAGDGSHA
ncbi:MAG: adenine nucleotide alpha hydrolase [SAR324 cluster bacterium]|nr:adenine nucleotide alpha hydrolase [SAR324 cluster bacterium]